MKDFALRLRMFFNKLSPLHIVYKQDASGSYIVDESKNPIPERYEPPKFGVFIAFVVLGFIVYGFYKFMCLVLTIKKQKT